MGIAVSNAALVLAISFGLAIGGIPLAKRVAMRLGVVAVPGAEFQHQRPTALLGGVAIVGAVLAALAITGNLPMWILLSAGALLVVGLVDDIVALRPRHKLAAQFIVALGVVAANSGFAIVHRPWVDSAIAVFWLVITTNAFNLIDGLDGLAAGVGAVGATAVAATAVLHGDPALAGWALALVGALGGFLIYNFPPASIFMGDAGALPVGLLLGGFALEAGRVTNSRLTAYVFPVLVMLVPILDTAIVSATRLATGRPISRRGLDHTHHRLLSLGLSDRTVALVCFALASLAATCAVGASVMPHTYLVIMLPFVILPSALIGLFMMDLTFDSRAPGMVYGYLPRIARLLLRVGYKLRMVEASLDLVLISAAYFGAFLIRLDFVITPKSLQLLMGSLPWVMVATYPAFVLTGVYRGMWRYAGMPEAVRFANGALGAGTLLLSISLFRPVYISGSTVLLFMILLANLLVVSRMSLRLLRRASVWLAVPIAQVLVVGAGRLGAAAGRDLTGGKDHSVRLVGFVDDDHFKQGKLMAGRPVLGSLDDLEQIYRSAPFNEIVIAIDNLAEQRLEILWHFANDHNMAVRRFSSQVDNVTDASSRRNGVDASSAATNGKARLPLPGTNI